MFSRDQKLGYQGELWAIAQLKKRGFDPQIPDDFFSNGLDILVDGLPIEVKYAKRTYRKFPANDGQVIYRPRWQWHIHPTSYAPGRDFVAILIAEDDSGKRHVFIVPSLALDGRSHVQITSHPDKYTGWMAEYKDQWGVINRKIGGNQFDGPLFNGVDMHPCTEQLKKSKADVPNNRLGLSGAFAPLQEKGYHNGH